MMSENLMGIPETRLADDPERTVASALAAGRDPSALAAQFPAASLPWAVLAERALDGGRSIEAYAYARTGYHRGLDALRRSGWRGQGPVPWSHLPNQGFLRALYALGEAAGLIDEQDERERCVTFLRGCDPTAEAALSGASADR